MEEFFYKIVGWIAAGGVIAFVIYTGATEAWQAYGIFAIIAPIAVVVIAFYLWKRSTQAKSHPWK